MTHVITWPYLLTSAHWKITVPFCKGVRWVFTSALQYVHCVLPFFIFIFIVGAIIVLPTCSPFPYLPPPHPFPSLKIQLRSSQNNTHIILRSLLKLWTLHQAVWPSKPRALLYLLMESLASDLKPGKNWCSVKVIYCIQPNVTYGSLALSWAHVAIYKIKEICVIWQTFIHFTENVSTSSSVFLDKTLCLIWFIITMVNKYIILSCF